MSSLFGGDTKVVPEFTGLQVNTSVQVVPIPIIYGCPRVNMNLIYYNGFINSLQKAAGKGLLSGGKGGGQENYYATIIMALGEGILPGVFIIYQNQSVWTPATFPSNGADYFSGTDTQTPWAVITTKWPADARPYKDTTYYGFNEAQLDSSATVPQMNIVPQGHFYATSPLNNSTITITTGQYDQHGNPMSFFGNIPLGDVDADPAQVIYDFLTNSTYGATFPANFTDTGTLFSSANAFDPNTGDTALSTYCQAVGLAWSVVLNNAESANNTLGRWCKNLNVAPVWNGAVLRFIPYWDRYANGNPGYDAGNPLGIGRKYFTPYTTPLVTITMDQILQSSAQDEDPITFSRRDPMEVFNTVRVTFKDRTNFFNDNVAEVKDEAHIELYGPRIDNIGSATEYSLMAYANVVATMTLRRNISIMRTFTWKMSPLWGWLDPMNIVNIPDPANYANFVAVRIISVEDDEEENVTVVAEEFPIGSQSPTTIPMAATTPPDQGAINVTPSDVYQPIIFEPSTAMLTAQGLNSPQIIIGLSGGNNPLFGGGVDPNWGGAHVWVSLDNVSYQEIGTLNGVSTIGGTSLPLPSYGGSNPDMVDTLTVNLMESDTALPSVSATAAANGVSICVIQDVSGFEILAYTTATLIGPFTYALTGLYRGLYGTTPRLFGAGSKFMAVGSVNNFFETSLPASYIGQTFYAKFQSFNITRTVTEDLSVATAYKYLVVGSTPTGPTVPPGQNTNRQRRISQHKTTRIPRRDKR